MPWPTTTTVLRSVVAGFMWTSQEWMRASGAGRRKTSQVTAAHTT
ncbi:Uncharacterised protein [Mycobacteroides abscessus subsp. abscessus]|nr:Uncharacterised protein [Mycobacteroides abscessus subsp. abscessus]